MAKKSYAIAFEIGGKLNASLPKSVMTAAGQLSRLGKQITDLEKSQGTSVRFRSLRNEIDQTKLKMRQAEAELKKLEGEMRATATPTAAMAKNFEAAKAKVEALRGTFKGQIAELRSVKAAMGAAGISTNSFAADTAKLQAQLAKLQRTQKAIRETQGARSANSAALGEAKGKLLGAAAGVAAFVLPVKVAADFEDSMARVGALSRATGGELTQLTATARQLGRDTRFSATAAAEGMQFLAQAGFSTTEIIAAMPGMLDIASAGAVDLGTASDITSNILKGFGMQAGESGRLGDVLTNTFTRSNTNLTLLGDTMKYVAPIAKATGVSLEMTAASAGILGDAGIKGEQAGTALRAMLSRLAAPARRGQEALRMLGVKTKDSKGNLLPFGDVLAKLNTKLSKFGTGTRQAAITHIFGMEAATAATVLLEKAGSGALQKFTKVVARSGTAAEIAAKQNATMKGMWDNIKGSVEDLGITIGDTLIPYLKSAIDSLVPVINAITQWLNEHPRLSTAIFGTAAAMAALFAVLTTGAVVFLSVKAAILGIKLALLLMNGAAIKAAAAFMLANAPLLLITAGVVGLIAIGWQLVENWTAIEDWWDKMWDRFGDKVASIVNQITPVLRGLGMNVQDMKTGDILARHRYSQRLIAGFSDKAEGFQAWDPNADAGPTWLKKGARAGMSMPAPATASPMLATVEKITEGTGGKKRGSIHYSPQINVAPGSAKGAREEVERGMQVAEKEFAAFLKKAMAEEQRVSVD